MFSAHTNKSQSNTITMTDADEIDPPTEEFQPQIGNEEESKQLLESGCASEHGEQEPVVNEGLSSVLKENATYIVTIVVFMLVLPLLAYDLGMRHYKGEKLRIAVAEQGIDGEQQANHYVLDSASQGFDEEEAGYHGLDIYVVGFAKTGTGSIRDFFSESEEVAMLGRENGDLFIDGTPENALMTLEKDFEEMPGSSDVLLRAVKKPGAIMNMLSLKRLVHYTSTDTKLVVGLRHPVTWLQSYYNYRLHKNADFDTPLEEFHQTHSESRFDLYMMQLGKAEISPGDLLQMANLGLEVVPNPYKVLVYHCEQMGDENEERAKALRLDFQEFLGLEDPIEAWPHNKVNSNETPSRKIDICDSEYDNIRQELIVSGRTAASWIRDVFIESDDVIVGGGTEAFTELIELWGTDVCPPTN